MYAINHINSQDKCLASPIANQPRMFCWNVLKYYVFFAYVKSMTMAIFLKCILCLVQMLNDTVVLPPTFTGIAKYYLHGFISLYFRIIQTLSHAPRRLQLWLWVSKMSLHCLQYTIIKNCLRGSNSSQGRRDSVVNNYIVMSNKICLKN